MGGNVITYQTNYSGLGGSQGGGIPSGVIPTPSESIEEFKVSVSNQTSDFNNSSGAQIQMTTKRGTNQFHGAAYMFYYDNAIGQANSWTNNHTPFTFGSSLHYTPPDFPKNHRSRFGGALGGPLLPSHSWAASGSSSPTTKVCAFRTPGTSSLVPSALMRAGIIQVPNAAGTYVPYNLTPQTIVYGGQTYPPAICPAGACDPRGLGVNPIVNPDLEQSDAARATTRWAATPSTPRDISGASPRRLTSNNYVGRIDHDFSDKQHFYLTYRDYKLINLTTNQVDVGGVLPGDQFGIPTATAPRPQQPSVWTAGLTSMLTPTTTNTFVFSYLRQFWQWGSETVRRRASGWAARSKSAAKAAPL